MSNDELKQHGLFKLPPEVRAKALAGMGITEDEYADKLRMQLDRNQRQAEAESKGETVHGWSKDGGWADDKPVGEVVNDD